MFRTFIILFFVLIPALIYCQDYNVKINLKDGSVVEGKLLKITAEGIDINPGGNVKFRFISADRIKNVEIVELNKTVEYPLTGNPLPEEIKDYESDEPPAQGGGFPSFLGIGSIGYASAGDWKYYEGFNSGSVWRLGLYYYFHESDISASRFLIGFTYNHLNIKGDKILGIEPNLAVGEYSFEFGRTTGLIGNGHYLYLIMGFVVVTNDIEMELDNSNGVSSSVHVNETKAALRIEGGGSINLGSKLSILLSLGYDILLGKNEQAYDYYYYDPNTPKFTIIGGIFNVSAGIAYGF